MHSLEREGQRTTAWWTAGVVMLTASLALSSAPPDALAATLQSLSYSYDNEGNVEALTDPLNGSQSFTYDELDRLKTANGPYGNYIYDYDEIGNLKVNPQVSPNPYVYPNSGANSVRPHAVTTAGANSYTYDANGNTLTGAGRTYTWNQENKPLTVVQGGTTSTFVYDGDGGRVKKIVGTTTTRYISKLYECDNTSCTRFIWAGNTRIATIAASGTIHYWHGDHLGSSSVITDSAGAKVETITYYPFGGTRTNVPGTPVNVPYKYTGKELDNTGLYYYEARYYDPALGRFISADTIIPNSRDPQDLNRYTYARNNPMFYTDPSGHCPICIVIVIGVVAGAVSSGIQSDWDFEATMTGAFIGGVSAAAGYSAFGPAAAAFSSLGPVGSGIAGGIVAGAVAGGTSGVLASFAGYNVNIGLAIASGAAAGGIVGGAGAQWGQLGAFVAAPAAGASAAAISGADPGMGAAIAAATAAFAIGVNQVYRNSTFWQGRANQGDLIIKVSDHNVSSSICRGDYNCYSTATSFTDNRDGSVTAHMRLKGPYTRVPSVSAYWSAKDPGGLSSFSQLGKESLGAFPLYSSRAYPGWDGIQHMMIPHTDGWLTLRSGTFLNTYGEAEGPFLHLSCLPRGCD